MSPPELPAVYGFDSPVDLLKIYEGIVKLMATADVSESGNVPWLQYAQDKAGPYAYLHPSLGIQSRITQAILVLEEYGPMWEAVMHVNEMQIASFIDAEYRLFITGQPGIGLSLFLVPPVDS